MIKLVLMIAMMATIAAASTVGARAQTAAKPTGAGAETKAPAVGPVSRPGGKPGPQVGQSQHPGFAPLTKNECKKLGGSLQDDTKCKNAKRCVITLANGDVNSICIDEFR